MQWTLGIRPAKMSLYIVKAMFRIKTESTSRPTSDNASRWGLTEQNTYCVYLDEKKADLTALVFG